MVASWSGVLHCPLFSSFPKLRSQQPWKAAALGAVSAVTLGSLAAASKASVLEETRKAMLKKMTMAALMDNNYHWPSAASHHVTPFASLTMVPMGKDEVVEPKTGVVFPAASAEGKQLTGVGLRKKSVFGLKNITVYAYGLYADPESLRSNLLPKYESAEHDKQEEEELFSDVTEADVALTIRLVVVYGKLKIGSIRSAFEESVGKGLKKFSGEENKELLGRFTSIFTDDLMLPKGTTIDISRLTGHVLETKIDGQEIGSVQSPLLCQALFDLYIGDDPFDKPAKGAMGLTLASILSTSS